MENYLNKKPNILFSWIGLQPVPIDPDDKSYFIFSTFEVFENLTLGNTLKNTYESKS